MKDKPKVMRRNSVRFTLRIGCAESCTNWRIGEYPSYQMAKEEAKIFSDRGFWIDIRKLTFKSSESEIMLKNTWNEEI